MNKNVVARQIPLAYKELETSGIVVKKDEYKLIPKGYRGQISAFGAAVTMGSLIPAVAFFSKKSGDQSSNSEEDVDRTKLMKAVFLLLKDDADSYGTAVQKAKFKNASDLMQYIYNVSENATDLEKKKKALKTCKEEIELKLTTCVISPSLPKTGTPVVRTLSPFLFFCIIVVFSFLSSTSAVTDGLKIPISSSSQTDLPIISSFFRAK